MGERKTILSPATAALLKGGEARAYVVERLEDRLASWRHDNEDSPIDSDDLFPHLAGQDLQLDDQNGLPPPPHGLKVAIRGEKESLMDCLVNCGLPPDFFSQRFRAQFPDKYKLIVKALDQKSRLGISIAESSEHIFWTKTVIDIKRPGKLRKIKRHASRESVKNALRKAGVIMAWANQPHSEPAAIAFVPSPKWIECRMQWQYTHDRPDPPSDEGEFPSVALVSLKAVERGILRRREERESIIIALPDGWRDDVIAKEEEQDKLRREIETAAVNAVAEYYLRQGFDNPPKSKELDNVGWDLEFRKGGKSLLRVEVKGKQTAKWEGLEVELTPNEIKKADNPRYRDSYRLAIVRDALRNPKCAIYARDGDGWRRVPDLGGNDEDAPDELMMKPSDSVIVRARNL